MRDQTRWRIPALHVHAGIGLIPAGGLGEAVLGQQFTMRNAASLAT